MTPPPPSTLSPAELVAVLDLIVVLRRHGMRRPGEVWAAVSRLAQATTAAGR